MKKLIIEIDDKLHAKYKAQCYLDGVTIKDNTTDLIKQFVEPLKLKDERPNDQD